MSDGRTRALLMGMGHCLAATSQIMKNRITIKSSNSISWYITKISEGKGLTDTVICMPTFTAALFTVATMSRIAMYPLMDKCVRKGWFMQTVRCYLILKIN